MSELVEFLRARFAAELDDIEGYDGGWNDVDGCWGIHVDPAFTRAEVEAKRAILDGYERMSADARETEDEQAALWALALLSALRHLAVPYASHPDYREEWKP